MEKKNKSAPGIGRLKSVIPNAWATNHKAKPHYRWPTTTNSHLIKIKVLCDHVKRIIVNPLNDMSICHIHQGYCKVGHNTFVWKIPTLMDCPVYSKKKKQQNRHSPSII